MARGDQLGRQWNILQRLIASQRGVSVVALAAELNCNRRTVYRDLEALQSAGFPLYNEREQGRTRWLLLEKNSQRSIPVPVNLTELMALHLSRAMLQSALEGTLFHRALDSFFQKIRGSLPPGYFHYLERLEQSLQVISPARKASMGPEDMIDRVREAVVGHRWVEMVYHTLSREQETERRVAPYRLWFFEGAFYLIGYCGLRRALRVFALGRIRSLRVTAETFEPPAGAEVDDYLRTSFGIFHGDPVKVRVRFSPRAAAYVKERCWHPTQKIVNRDDGSILFEAEVAGTTEIRFWILRWGADATVLEPAELREQISAEARALTENYRDAGRASGRDANREVSA